MFAGKQLDSLMMMRRKFIRKKVKVNAKGDFTIEIQPNGGFVLRN